MDDQTAPEPKLASPQASPESSGPTPPAEPYPPCLPPEPREGFPTHFARIFFGVITLLVLYYAYQIIKPYLIDIFMALVLFFTAKPLYRGLSRVFFGRRVIASALTCLILALVIIVPLSALVGIIASQALEFSTVATREMQSGEWWHWIIAKIEAVKLYLLKFNLPLPPGEIQLDEIIRTVATKASVFVYSNAIGLLKGFTSFVLDLLLVLFIAFFMFLQGDDFIAALKNLSPLDAAHNEDIVREMEVTIKATLWGTVIVAFIQGVLGGLGFFMFGLPQPAFWGTVMIPAAVIPVVGSAIIWGPAAIYLLATGHLGAGIGLIAWGGVVVSVIDNVLKPILMKGSSDAPSVFILFSILGGIGYFGMIGFILGPLILSFLLSLLRIYQKNILQPAATPAPAVPGPGNPPGQS